MRDSIGWTPKGWQKLVKLKRHALRRAGNEGMDAIHIIIPRKGEQTLPAKSREVNAEDEDEQDGFTEVS